jgi:microcystin degradation protein MlrC
MNWHLLSVMIKRREFFRKSAGMLLTALGGSITAKAFTGIHNLNGKFSVKSKDRIFYARFAHETNTFHPVLTTSWSISGTGSLALNAWQNADFEIIPGLSAAPDGGGLITEAPCREVMDRILDSLRHAMPVDAVFLSLHGAMYAEVVGHAETVLAGKIRELTGPGIPIACTFDLHGNIPARLGQYGDILAGLKTAPHTDSTQTAELAGQILLDTLEGKVNRSPMFYPYPSWFRGRKP